MIGRILSVMLVSLGVVLAAASCAEEPVRPELIATASLPTTPWPDLDQGWTTQDRFRWYRAGQGSRLLPRAWLDVLEQPHSEARFLDKAYIESRGYLWPGDSGDQSLPLGFAVDTQSDERLSITRLRWKEQQGDKEPWVGLTCSACHTAELSYQGKPIRVDGGPAHADFQSLLEDLNATLAETVASDAKFGRFAGRVLQGQDSPSNRNLLRSALKKLSAWQNELAALNRTPLRYGFARLDAFGHIFNKVAKLAAGAQATGNPSDAPVSYPFLWNVPQLDKVQWNGIAPNDAISLPGGRFQYGALGRNTGEVIGVFADIAVRPGAPFGGYSSSVDVANLDSIEGQLARLKPPRWPSELFGKPAPDLVAEGEKLFTSKCSHCHQHLDRNDLRTQIETTRIRLVAFEGEQPIGTDPWMACNAYKYQSLAGSLRGTPLKYFSGPKLQGTAPLSNMLGVVVAGTLAGEKGDVIRAAGRAFFGVTRPPRVSQPPILETVPVRVQRSAQKQAQIEDCIEDAPSVEILGYQSRPLTGIWATAPYLHNGSVRTLYQLLMPPAQREKAFHVGSRDFDPIDVGFSGQAGTGGVFLFETRNAAGDIIDGNSNLGHDYGNARFSERERRALVEYMKTL